MKREILYRGKRKADNTWISGLFVNNNYGAWIVNYCDIVGRFEYQEVIPETVGQFTGLKDDCNNNIFEGDILTYNTMRFVVVFHEYSFRMKRMNERGVIIPLPPTDRFYTIIGNIHDNQELIKQGGVK